MAASLSGFGWTDRVRKILKPARIATALGRAVGGFCLFVAAMTAETAIFPTHAGAQSLQVLGSGPAAPPPSSKTPGQDQVQAAYQVSDVPVDATAANAAQARESAIASGQVKALEMLLQRLVDPSQFDRLPHPSAADVDRMVLRLSIRDEKTSAVRYLAKIDVTFMPQAVKALLDRSHISYIETATRPSLVLPVWYAAADAPATLWEEPNPWRQAWATRRSGGLVSTEVPLGDLADIGSIDAARAVALDQAALSALAQRYAADSVLVVEAHAHKTPQSIASNPDLPALDIRVRRVSATPEEAIALTVLPETGEDISRFLARAVSLTAQSLDKGFRAQAVTAAAAGPINDTPVLLEFSSLNEWAGLRQSLDQTPGMKDWKLTELRRSAAQASLRYTSTFEELVAGLASVGLSATLEPQGWVIRREVPQTTIPGGQSMPSILTPSSPQGSAPVSTPGVTPASPVAPAAGYPGSQSSVTIR